MLPERKIELENRIDRYEKGMRYTLIGVYVCILILLGFIIVQQFQTQAQLSQTLTQIKNAAAQNHQKTQNYIKCIAEGLTVPIAQRSTDVFEQCGLPTKTSNSQAAQPAPQAPHATPTPSTAPEPSPQTTPQPKAPAAQSNPIGGVIKSINDTITNIFGD